MCLAGQEAIRKKSLLLCLFIHPCGTILRIRSRQTFINWGPGEHQPIRPLPLCIAPLASRSLSPSILFAMSPLPRFLAALALLAFVTPSVMASNSVCKSNEFWYDNQSCCVSKNPPKTYPSPP